MHKKDKTDTATTLTDFFGIHAPKPIVKKVAPLSGPAVPAKKTVAKKAAQKPVAKERWTPAHKQSNFYVIFKSVATVAACANQAATTPSGHVAIDHASPGGVLTRVGYMRKDLPRGMTPQKRERRVTINALKQKMHGPKMLSQMFGESAPYLVLVNGKGNLDPYSPRINGQYDLTQAPIIGFLMNPAFVTL